MVQFDSKYVDAASGSTGVFFIKVYNNWHRRIKSSLDKLSITHPQYVALASLNYLSVKKSKVRQVDISNLSDMDAMTISDILKLLKKKKLVERKNSILDNRAKVVYLTTKGLQIKKQATEIVKQIDLEFFGKLGSENKMFLSLLKQLL